ncbi:hypothetical protein ACI797_16515 [Geodermatophilus sp. SYSU D00691]
MVGRHRRPETEFRLLFVCTGNVCRSPFAELLTRHELVHRLSSAEAAAFHIRSAGTQAAPRADMHPSSRRELRPWELDGEAEQFLSRRLTPAQVEESDLILGMSPHHRSAILQETPQALGITFTLREFARLSALVDLEGLPEEPVPRAHALVEAARLRRGLVPPVDPEEDSVPDPIGQPQEAHHRAAELIRSAVDALLNAIAAPPAPERQIAIL